MTSPKTIRDKIIAILETAKPANGEGKHILKIFRGEPPKSRWPGFPWGWVEWSGGPMEPPVGTMSQVRDSFTIAVIDKNVDAEKAEDSIMDFAESVEAVLGNDRTFGGSVAYSWVSNRDKFKAFIDGDYSMVAVKITLSTRRRE